MKNILIAIGLFLTSSMFGQAVDWDSIPHKTSAANADYMLLISGTGTSEVFNGMSAEYSIPWVYSGGLVYPRLAGNNVSVGATTNPYGDKVYVNGVLRSTGNTFVMGRVYIGAAGTSYLSATSTNVYITDPTTGTKSLAQLYAGGSSTGIDLTLVPNNSIIMERADTAYGTSSLLFNDTALILKSIAALSTFAGEDAGKGITSTETTSSGFGYSASSDMDGTNNSGFGPFSNHNMVGSNNSSLGLSAGNGTIGSRNIHVGSTLHAIGDSNMLMGNLLAITGTGNMVFTNGLTSTISKQLIINDKGGNRFTSLIWGDFLNDSLRFNAKVVIRDSTQFTYFNNTAKAWVFATVNKRLKTGTLTPAGFMTTFKLPSIRQYLRDKKNGEFAWYYQDTVWVVHKVYDLSTIDPIFQLQCLQSGIEMDKRYIGRQESKITILLIVIGFVLVYVIVKK